MLQAQSQGIGTRRFRKSTEGAEAKRLLAALKDCSRSRDLPRGLDLHSQAIVSGHFTNARVVSSLINMYAKCGSIADARKVFDSSCQFLQHDVVSWTALIMGYVENGQRELALELFDGLGNASGDCIVNPNARTFVAALAACAALADAASGDGERVGEFSGCSRWLNKGKEIHARAVINRCSSDIFVGNSLINMYSKCGATVLARSVFDGMVLRDVVSWTAILQAYVENGQSEFALELFDCMEGGGVLPDVRSYSAALSACASLAWKEVRRTSGKCSSSSWLQKGRSIHGKAVANDCCNTFVKNTLIEMYSRCGSMAEARSVFDGMTGRDSVSWNSLLQGYVDNGKSDLALELFDSMKGGASRLRNSRTYVAALTACATSAAEEIGSLSLIRSSSSRKSRWLQKGKAIHSEAVANSCCNIFVESTLVDLYSKCGSMVVAREVFDKMRRRNSVSWNALLMGYVQNGENEIVLELIAAMQNSGVERDPVTYAAALKACGNLMEVQSGKDIHSEAVRRGFEAEEVVVNSLVDFYGKCGCMRIAKVVFDSIDEQTTFSWTALMCGYGQQGDFEQVFEAFEEMKEEDVAADEATFVCVLAACSHAGAIGKVKAVLEELGNRATVKHYACLIDLLGRANCVEEAMAVLRSMPCEADAVAWTSVLSACKKWGNVDVGRAAYESLLELGDEDGGLVACVLMANLYDSPEIIKPGDQA